MTVKLFKTALKHCLKQLSFLAFWLKQERSCDSSPSSFWALISIVHKRTLFRMALFMGRTGSQSLPFSGAASLTCREGEERVGDAEDRDTALRVWILIYLLVSISPCWRWRIERAGEGMRQELIFLRDGDLERNHIKPLHLWGVYACNGLTESTHSIQVLDFCVHRIDDFCHYLRNMHFDPILTVFFPI